MSIARYLEPHERQALLSELPSPRDRLLVVLGLNSGMRVGSIISLRWKQLVWNGEILPAFEVPRRNLKGGRGRHRKSISSRRVPINETLRGAILQHLRAEFGAVSPPPDGWVFTSRKRWPGVITRQHAHAIISAAAARAGLPPGVAPHSLRRSFGGDLFSASGHNLLLVQQALGHSSPVVTALYLRPQQDEVDDLIRGLPFRTQVAISTAAETEVQTRISGT